MTASSFKTTGPKVGRGRTFIGNYMEHLTTSAGQSLQRPVNLYGKKVVYLPCMVYFAIYSVLLGNFIKIEMCVDPEENGDQCKQTHVLYFVLQ